ncbi:MAG: cyclodeaminase/cyclohydrolase family protein [Spirochaetales bacterium]|nr:cyclodeaminase/cyclohydrolase family protein [Spirochaetales bacterium]
MSNSPFNYNEVSISAYCDALGSNAATPGGGSAAGVVLSLAANCAAKAAVFSGIDDTLAVRTFYDRCKDCAAKALQLAADDERTFLAWKDARALPKDTPAEQEVRTAAVNEAVTDCISVPYNLAKLSLSFRDSLEPFRPLCKKWLLSDLDVAKSFASAAFEAALANIDINMPFLKDERLKREIEEFVGNHK